MTVEELIAELEKLPVWCKVYRAGGEYFGDYRLVEQVVYHPNATLGMAANTVILD